MIGLQTMNRRQLLRDAAVLTGSALIASCERKPEIVRFANEPFTLGVASGYPTASSVVLWTRLAPSPLEPDGGMPAVPTPVTWEIASDDRFATIVASGEALAWPEWAQSVRVEVAGLAPNRPYWYRFRSDAAESAVGLTKTVAQAEAMPSALKFALACCQHYENGHYAAYAAMADDAPDAIIHVGDYIYEDAGIDRVRRHDYPEARTLSDYRQRYALYKLDASLQRAHAAAAWLVTWDDHEVENDYADLTTEADEDPEAFRARRAAAYRAYYEHLPLPPRMQPTSTSEPLIYGRHSFGNLVDVYLLDGRQYRSAQACGYGLTAACAERDRLDRTMLGADQERWLTESLDARMPRWNLLAQQTVFANMDQRPGIAEGYWSDGWSGYPAARAKLVELLDEQQVPNPVVLSGDVHAFLVNDVHRRAGELESPVVATEIVTSSISSAGPSQALLDAWRDENPNVRFADARYRGYTRLTLAGDRLDAELVAVDDLSAADSSTHTLASWHVLDGEPGAVT
jgi:alkaline phosphatase D